MTACGERVVGGLGAEDVVGRTDARLDLDEGADAVGARLGASVADIM
jgi:hypothetical protein